MAPLFTTAHKHTLTMKVQEHIEPQFAGPSISSLLTTAPCARSLASGLGSGLVSAGRHCSLVTGVRAAAAWPHLRHFGPGQPDTSALTRGCAAGGTSRRYIYVSNAFVLILDSVALCNAFKGI